MLVSATIAIGDCPSIDTEAPSFLIEARGLEIPSWAAEVGTLMKGWCSWVEHNFAVSMTDPPPTPITIPELCFRILSQDFSTASSVAFEIITISTLNFAS